MRRLFVIAVVFILAGYLATSFAQRGRISADTIRNLLPVCAATTGPCPSDDYFCRDQTDSFRIYVCDSPNVWSTVQDGGGQGPTGPQGDAGSTGPAGAQGATGAAGPSGPSSGNDAQAIHIDEAGEISGLAELTDAVAPTDKFVIEDASSSDAKRYVDMDKVRLPKINVEDDNPTSTTVPVASGPMTMADSGTIEVEIDANEDTVTFHDASTHTVCMYIEAPSNETFDWVWRAPQAVTVKGIACDADAGAPKIQWSDDLLNDIFLTTLTCGDRQEATNPDTGAGGYDHLAAGDWVSLTISDWASATVLSACLTYTVDY